MSPSRRLSLESRHLPAEEAARKRYHPVSAVQSLAMTSLHQFLPPRGQPLWQGAPSTQKREARVKHIAIKGTETRSDPSPYTVSEGCCVRHAQLQHRVCVCVCVCVSLCACCRCIRWMFSLTITTGWCSGGTDSSMHCTRRCVCVSMCVCVRSTGLLYTRTYT